MIAARLPPDHTARSAGSGVDPIRNARAPAELKRDLLGELYASGGPEAILAIGRNLHGVAHDPIWSAALSSADPWILLEKWRRFENYAHWNNRTVIERQSDASISVRRYAADGSTPTAPENLMVCSLLTGLLAQVGCRYIECILGAANPVTIIERDRPVQPLDVDAADTGQWQISWTHHEPQTPVVTEQSKVEKIVGTDGLSEPVIRALEHLLADPSRSWTLAALADACHLSERTLQRRLHEANLSFSKIVRLVRIHEACALLQTTDLPATAIGFCTGFSDSAHFSRDFSASMGLAPRAYRQLFKQTGAGGQPSGGSGLSFVV